MKVSKAEFDKELDKLIKSPPLPMTSIPKQDGTKRKAAKKATRRK